SLNRSAGELVNLPAVAGNGLVQDLVVPSEGIFHRRSVLLPKRRAALNLGEQEGHRAAGQRSNNLTRQGLSGQALGSSCRRNSFRPDRFIKLPGFCLRLEA